MFKKILIANRGEIALRVIRTCREMGIKTVAVYSTADKESLHVKFADEAVCIGKPASFDSYLNIPHIMAAAEITNADAIHPGYGFLAENARFAEICGEHEIKFIGPTPAMINAMGDKITAKETMIKAGVPVVPGGQGLLGSLDEAKGMAKEVGYPIILKATAGGGGKGMRVVWAESDMERAYNTAKAEAGASFKNDGIYMEKFVEEPRHIEIQVAGDQYGKVCHLSERDCSIQRRHQKLVEESPSPFMTEELRRRMGDAAIKAASAINYESVGTIEFLVDKHRNFYFMEMNTRIQVEHCVTEEVVNFDLIKEQIKIAQGEAITADTYNARIAGRPAEIAEIRKVFDSVDAFITPTHAFVAPPLTVNAEGDPGVRQFTVPISYTGFPAVSVPCGFNSAGLPVGMQIVAEDFEERLLFRGMGDD